MFNITVLKRNLHLSFLETYLGVGLFSGGGGEGALIAMLRYVITDNSRLAYTPLLRTLAITDKIQITGESYRGLTGNDSRYYGITDTFGGTKRTILLFCN